MVDSFAICVARQPNNIKLTGSNPDVEGFSYGCNPAKKGGGILHDIVKKRLYL